MSKSLFLFENIIHPRIRNVTMWLVTQRNEHRKNHSKQFKSSSGPEAGSQDICWILDTLFAKKNRKKPQKYHAYLFLGLVFLWPCLELSPFTAHKKLVCAWFTLDLPYFPAFKYNKEEKESMLRPLHWRTWDSRREQRAPCLSDCKHCAVVRKTVGGDYSKERRAMGKLLRTERQGEQAS